VCVRACVSVCVRVCVRACVRVCTRALFKNISMSQFYRNLYHEENPPGNFETKWLMVYRRVLHFGNLNVKLKGKYWHLIAQAEG